MAKANQTLRKIQDAIEKEKRIRQILAITPYTPDSTMYQMLQLQLEKLNDDTVYVISSSIEAIGRKVV